MDIDRASVVLLATGMFLLHDRGNRGDQVIELCDGAIIRWESPSFGRPDRYKADSFITFIP